MKTIEEFRYDLSQVYKWVGWSVVAWLIALVCLFYVAYTNDTWFWLFVPAITYVCGLADNKLNRKILGIKGKYDL
jgi:hypothetical protein